MNMYPRLIDEIKALALRSNELTTARKAWMDQLAHYLASTIEQKGSVAILSMCTHNSRRSQLSMAWVHALAHYFDLPIQAYSAGVEITECQSRTLVDLEHQGFIVSRDSGINPRHEISIAKDASPILAWSKLASQSEAPKGFAALIYCENAASVQKELPNCGLRLECLLKDSPTPGPELEHSPIQEQISTELFYALAKVRALRGST